MTTGRSLLFLGRILLIGAALAAVAAAPPPKVWKTVRIGIDSFNPPFSTIDPDQGPAGFDVAIAKALCDRLQVHCDFVPVARAALVGDLLARRSDAVVASLPITDENRKSVEFTDKYHSTDGRFAVGRNTGLTSISPETMHGRQVGALEGSLYAIYLADAYASKGAIVKLYHSDADAETDLRAGRIAAFFGSSIRLYHWFDDGSGTKCCHFVGSEVRSPKILGDGAGIAVRKEDTDLRDLFNKALADILRDGTYEKINATYFNFLIY